MTISDVEEARILILNAIESQKTYLKSLLEIIRRMDLQQQEK